MNWIRIRELVRKEFIQLFRDKKSRSILTIAPLVQLLIFGYIVTMDVRDIRVGFLDQSLTRESRMLADAFSGNKTFRITHSTDDPKDLEEILLRKKIDLAVKVGPDFSEHIRKGKTFTEIIALGDEERLEELALMMGGKDSAAALDLARQLMD